MSELATTSQRKRECACTRDECPRHGNCKACMQFHKERGDSVFCQRQQASASEERGRRGFFGAPPGLHGLHRRMRERRHGRCHGRGER